MTSQPYIHVHMPDAETMATLASAIADEVDRHILESLKKKPTLTPTPVDNGYHRRLWDQTKPPETGYLRIPMWPPNVTADPSAPPLTGKAHVSPPPKFDFLVRPVPNSDHPPSSCGVIPATLVSCDGGQIVYKMSWNRNVGPEEDGVRFTALEVKDLDGTIETVMLTNQPMGNVGDVVYFELRMQILEDRFWATFHGRRLGD